MSASAWEREKNKKGDNMGSRDIDERDDSDVVVEETTKTIVDVADERGHKNATIGAIIGGGIGSFGGPLGAAGGAAIGYLIGESSDKNNKES